MTIEIRNAKDSDVNDINDLYNYYIRETAFTFDIQEKNILEKESWLKRFNNNDSHLCLVGLVNNNLVGFVSSDVFREKEAYKNSIESSVYINPDHFGKGYGKQLMISLINKLKDKKIKRIYALITSPNNPSVNMHKALGFVKKGVLDSVGFKFDKYWDVDIYELKL